MKAYRYLTEKQINTIRVMSSTHYPRQIAEIIGCTPEGVAAQQKKMGIVNPKRKFKLHKRGQTFATKEGYFDLEAWAKEMSF